MNDYVNPGDWKRLTPKLLAKCEGEKLNLYTVAALGWNTKYASVIPNLLVSKKSDALTIGTLAQNLANHPSWKPEYCKKTKRYFLDVRVSKRFCKDNLSSLCHNEEWHLIGSSENEVYCRAYIALAQRIRRKKKKKNAAVA